MRVERLAFFVERFMESDVMKVVKHYGEYRHSPQSLYDAIKNCLIIVGILILCFVDMTIKDKHVENLMKKGTYKKELPIRKVRISFKSRRSFTLLFKTKTVKTKDAEGYEKARRENRQTKLDFAKAVLALIPKDEPVLLKRHGSFRLDASNSWEKKKNEEWLSDYRTILNIEGYTVALLGGKEGLAECGYDIFVPKSEAGELSAMTVEELLKFCEEENCKLQIKEKGSEIVFSDAQGYTEADIVRAIKLTAEEKGIKVRIN